MWLPEKKIYETVSHKTLINIEFRKIVQCLHII